jgi:dihydropteroate synthase
MSPNEFSNWLATPHRRPLVMGVVNITPDSFSDGGRYFDPEAALALARQMVADGADLLDIGGESTRPGALPVAPEEQIRRVRPVIETIARQKWPVTLSIDTTSAEVAKDALDAGANVINDISGGRHDPAMLPLAAARAVPIALMHMQGTPQTMQNAPVYADVVREICKFLLQAARRALAAGVKQDHILLDPGIGFGKTMVHNLQLLASLRTIADLGYPLLVGTSRKKFIGTLTGDPNPADRRIGTAASVGWSIAQGAAIVRVHDVADAVKVVKVVGAIMDPSIAAGTKTGISNPHE